MSADFDCIVIGAGVVGLAIAREASMQGHSTLIVERHGVIGSETSSRNSEVIHAGIYYPTGSLKAQCCLEGRERLYRFALERGVPHRKCGKIIVAAGEHQNAELEAIQRRAIANGVSDMRLLDRADLNKIEPDVSGCAALYSPSTGMIDSHAFMLALLGEADAHDTQLALNTEIAWAERRSGSWAIGLVGDSEPAVTARFMINSTGLFASEFTRLIQGYPNERSTMPFFAKGTYFSYDGRVPFKHLVYPVPEPGGLGVHLTLDLQGRARFGPDVEWVDQPDYNVDTGKRSTFAEAIRAYWSNLDPERLQPGYVGVRPKIVGPGEPAADFVIEGPGDHGLPGLVNLLGIESPGLTSSLALARLTVEEMTAAD